MHIMLNRPLRIARILSGIVASVILAACSDTSAEPAVVDNCDHEAQAIFGPQYVEFETEEEMREKMQGYMFFPDPETLPEGSTMTLGYYNANDKYDFMQSTHSIVYVSLKDDIRRSVEVIYYNEIQPAPEPPNEPHEVIQVRGKDAYHFEGTMGEDEMHSIMVREGCRKLTVIGNFAFESVLEIAENMSIEPAP